MIIVRYADDIIVGFEHEADARRFLEAMRERLGEFALSLHPDKTRLIEFGRHAATNRERRGLGKPETFDFLGFTFGCGKSRRGKFLLKKENPARPHAGEAASHQAGAAAAQAPADPGPGEMAETGRQGLLQLPCRADQQSGAGCIPLLCHRTSGNDRSSDAAKRRHRPGSRSRSWPKTGSRNRDILHPWPRIRFAVTYPRWEPYAGKPHVRYYVGALSNERPYRDRRSYAPRNDDGCCSALLRHQRIHVLDRLDELFLEFLHHGTCGFHAVDQADPWPTK